MREYGGEQIYKEEQEVHCIIKCTEQSKINNDTYPIPHV